MHISVFTVLIMLLGTAVSTATAVACSSVLHLFGARPSHEMGVWTMPNALVIDLFADIFIVTLIVWPLVSSVFIYCLRRGVVDHFTIPAWLRPLRKGLPLTVWHTPIVTLRGGQNGKHSFSWVAFQLMITKAVVIAFALFTFVVMPTCAIVTVKQQSEMFNKLPNRPHSCSAYKILNDPGYNLSPTYHDVFESLCWTFAYTLQFVAIWSSATGAAVAGLSLCTAAIQFEGKEALRPMTDFPEI